MKPKIKESDFQEQIDRAIKEGRHVSDLKQFKKDFKKYKKFFETQAFVETNNTNEIYRFKVTYLDSSPFWSSTVWRDIEMLGKQTFELFADEIIFSMGWLNDHMHGFRFPDLEQKPMHFACSPYQFFAPGWEDDPHPTLKSDQVRINQVDYKKFPRLHFEFDYGDGHEFQIDYKGKRRLDANGQVEGFPRLVKQKGTAPDQYRH